MKDDRKNQLAVVDSYKDAITSPICTAKSTATKNLKYCYLDHTCFCPFELDGSSNQIQCEKINECIAVTLSMDDDARTPASTK